MLQRVLIPLLLLVFALPGAAEPELSAREEVRRGADAVVAVIQDPDLDRAAKRARIDTIVRQHFDFDAMSRSALARNWREASEAQQQRFLELFPALIINTYFAAVDTYQGETVDVGEEKVRGSRVFVDTEIVTPSKRIPVTYRLRARNGRWQAYDVVIEGVSMLSSYRSSFGSIISRNGMDALLAQLADKLAAAEERALDAS